MLWTRLSCGLDGRDAQCFISWWHLFAARCRLREQLDMPGLAQKAITVQPWDVVVLASRRVFQIIRLLGSGLSVELSSAPQV